MSRRERGQATVELALTLPMIVLAAWLPVATATVASAQMELAAAARNAAREAAMSHDPTDTALDAAKSSTAMRPLRTDTVVAAGIVRVEVSTRYRLPLPLPRALTPSITLWSRAAASSEMFLGTNSE